MQNDRVLRVAVTGTKGKTTVVRVLSQVLQAYTFDRVLHVDTTGHFVNGERKSTLEDSTKTWGLVPSVAPGRYLYEFMDRNEGERLAAVLETSLGCSTLSGMGYALHDVGVFLNVFEDHIGNSERIKSQSDIVAAKEFVVTRVLKEGFAVLNFDDPLVKGLVSKVSTERSIRPMYFGKNITRDVLPAEYQDVPFVTIRDNQVVYVRGDTETPIVQIADVKWTFNGLFKPSIYNLLAVTAAAIAVFDGVIPEGLGEKLAKTELDRYGGRLTRLRSKDGVEIIADYAHEKQSLIEIATLARGMTTQPHGRVLGVVRLAYDRTDALITETGKAIAAVFDSLVVYDKIDGYWKQPKEKLQFDRFTQEVGKISKTLSDAIKSVNPNCVQIIREDEALSEAAKQAKPGDVVVVIVNDDITRSVNFIKESFGAEFV